MKPAALLPVLLVCGEHAWADPAAGPAPARAGSAAPTRAHDPDDEFRAKAIALARREHRHVHSWGTMALDETGHRFPFAELVPAILDGSVDRNAFLIEQAPGVLWLVTLRVRIRGFTTEEDESPPPPWSTLDAKGIHHEYHFFNGHETIDFAWRGGKPVVERYEYDGDYRDEFAQYIVRDHAKTGCTPSCPALANYRFREAAARIVGPAPTIDRLVDVEPPPLGIDWANLALTSDADALAVWQRLALASNETDLASQVPEGPWRGRLAIALLRSGSFRCPEGCKPPERPTPALSNPYARQQLALWALATVGQTGDADEVADVLRALVRSERALGVAAIDAAGHDTVLHQELIALAWRARPLHRNDPARGDLQAPRRRRVSRPTGRQAADGERRLCDGRRGYAGPRPGRPY